MDNPQAFPSKDIKVLYPEELKENLEFIIKVHEIKVEHKGMTLRDYFAGQAITGLAESTLNSNYLSNWAYELADAMLKQRSVDESGD